MRVDYKAKYKELSLKADMKSVRELKKRKLKPKYRKGMACSTLRLYLERNNYEVVVGTQVRNETDLFKVACMAYSWMPTMLEFFFPVSYDFNPVIKLLQKLNKSSLSDAEKLNLVMCLAEGVNHSIVGTSKILHIINPAYVPLIDSRVMKGWNKLFKKEIAEGSLVKMPNNLFFKYGDGKSLIRKVNIYLYYWGFLAEWKNCLGKSVSLRDIEFKLYMLGG